MGYKATHFQAKLKQDNLSNVNARYSDAYIEIQVTSLLMHAWAEVEHDLVYKPYQGQLSDTELALLDQLNGIVLCGEYSLETLQESMNQRIKNSKGSFSDHYGLASFIFSKYKPKDSSKLNMGDFELLFKFLDMSNINDSKQVDTLIKAINKSNSSFDVSSQIIDHVITDNPKLFNLYQKIRNDKRIDDLKVDISAFLDSWITIEEILYNLVNDSIRFPQKSSNSALKRRALGLHYNDYLRIRNVRNNIVHGTEVYEQDYLDKCTDHLKKIINYLQKYINND